ncbi:MAG TPA: heavy-metal-associated domain-containing protein [Candidatus Nanoarchaeia archaeon]|nr:heavy-metal-associated domain-containing protein [Candidatus Nanoarchaeia archaeon]
MTDENQDGEENMVDKGDSLAAEDKTISAEREPMVRKEDLRVKRVKTKIYIPDIECDSCAKLIRKKVANIEGVIRHDIHADSVDMTYDENMIKAEDLVMAIEDLGFRAAVRPFERLSFRERWKSFQENPQKYAMITQTIGQGAMVFMLLIALQALAYFGFLNTIPGFFDHYAWWLLYIDISVASIGATILYISSYKGTVTCMTGMMIGMTVGMQAGMMIGAVVGATNGFFTGAMVGMTVAVIAGTITGAVCGIMGALQGMMTGVMAGTMGAMITVMMFTDRVLIFMPYYITLNVLVLFGLIYLFYEEVVEGKKDATKRSLDFNTFASACVIITAVLTAIMIYGPKSQLFA